MENDAVRLDSDEQDERQEIPEDAHKRFENYKDRRCVQEQRNGRSLS
jgi:hypothetical protein